MLSISLADTNIVTKRNMHSHVPPYKNRKKYLFPSQVNDDV